MGITVTMRFHVSNIKDLKKQIVFSIFILKFLCKLLVINIIQQQADEKQTPSLIDYSICNKFGPSMCNHLIYQSVKISDIINHTSIQFIHNKINKAKVAHGECMNETINSSSYNIKMILLTNFIYKSVDQYSHSEQEYARIWEIISTIQHNLNHWSVHTVNLFVELQTSVQFLQRIDFENSQKLVIQWVKRDYTLQDILLFVSKCIKGHITAITNSDIRFGKGFEKIRPSYLLDNQLMYTLTRHISLTNKCAVSSRDATCTPGYPTSKYIGSHDAFIFHVGSFNESTFEYLEGVKLGLLGAENLLMWVFKNKLGYRLLNPCFTLFIHHEHCVYMRRENIRRVNLVYSERQSYTDK